MNDREEHKHPEKHDEHVGHQQHEHEQAPIQSDFHGAHAVQHHPEPETPEEYAEEAIEAQPEHAHGAGHGAETAMVMDEAG
ncbi:MAG: hypothetical protein JW730_05290, partial [Anaerolineales bacterium]|nr:hypothetical protein [Anaerolineales bacterium]